MRGSTVRAAAGSNWLRAGAALFGAAWGSNQFTPMLLVYRQQLGLSTGTLEALFGVYALGLIPGLLIAGPLSDARGRRPVILASAVLSLAGTVALLVAGHSVAPLFVGRFLTGLGSGAAFGTGTAWLRELSRPPFGHATDHGAARRGAVAMTVGFAAGPLVSGLLAQWASDPRVVAYLPHPVLMLGVLAVVPGAPETVARGGAGAITRALPSLRQPRFYRVVAPMAPWVFAAPAVAFALLPSVVGAAHATDGIALTAVVTMATAMAGVFIQPVARRLDAHAGNRAATLGLTVIVAGLVLAAVTAHAQETWLLIPTSIVLGTGYGLCLVGG